MIIIEKLENANKVIKALSQSQNMPLESFVKQFNDDFELYEILYFSLSKLKIEEKFLISAYLGFCPMCFSTETFFTIEQITTILKIDISWLTDELNKAYQSLYERMVQRMQDKRR